MGERAPLAEAAHGHQSPTLTPRRLALAGALLALGACANEDAESSPEYDDTTGFDDDCEAQVGEYYTALTKKQAAR